MAEPTPVLDAVYPIPQSLVHDRRGSFEMESPIHGIYDISHDRCDTPEKLFGWLEHLSHKRWVTRDHLRDLIECAAHRFPKAIRIERGL